MGGIQRLINKLMYSRCQILNSSPVKMILTFFATFSECYLRNNVSLL